jgi:hypothetical protein
VQFADAKIKILFVLKKQPKIRIPEVWLLPKRQSSIPEHANKRQQGRTSYLLQTRPTCFPPNPAAILAGREGCQREAHRVRKTPAVSTRAME